MAGTCRKRLRIANGVEEEQIGGVGGECARFVATERNESPELITIPAELQAVIEIVADSAEPGVSAWSRAGCFLRRSARL